MDFRSPLGRAAAAVAVLPLLSCGGGGSPTAGTPPTTLTPSPTPKPTPTPAATANLCKKLGFVPDPNTRCGTQAQIKFQTQVNSAIAQVRMRKADIFQNGPLGIYTNNPPNYIASVVDALNQSGVCAGFDGEEIQVKSSNDANEQYKILASNQYLVDPANYRSTCMPAAFPTPAPPNPAPPPGCGLPSSHEIACGPAPPNYLALVKSAIDLTIQQHPEIFDLTETHGAPDAYKVLDPPKYHEYVRENLQQNGRCARFDGEEIAVKASNDFSENYDILTGDNFIRRGDGEFRVACYPADF